MIGRIRPALIIEVVQQADQAPRFFVGVELSGVGTQGRFDRQPVLPQAIVLWCTGTPGRKPRRGSFAFLGVGGAGAVGVAGAADFGRRLVIAFERGAGRLVVGVVLRRGVVAGAVDIGRCARGGLAGICLGGPFDSPHRRVGLAPGVVVAVIGQFLIQLLL